jgi:hypothetical protein
MSYSTPASTSWQTTNHDSVLITRPRIPVKPTLYGPEDFRGNKGKGSKKNLGSSLSAPAKGETKYTEPTTAASGTPVFKCDLRSTDIVLGRDGMGSDLFGPTLSNWWEAYAHASHSGKRKVCNDALGDLYDKGFRFLRKVDKEGKVAYYLEEPRGSSAIMQKLLRVLRGLVVANTSHLSSDEKCTRLAKKPFVGNSANLSPEKLKPYIEPSNVNKPVKVDAKDTDTDTKVKNEPMLCSHLLYPQPIAKIGNHFQSVPPPPLLMETLSSLGGFSQSPIPPIPSAIHWGTSDIYKCSAPTLKSVSPDTVLMPPNLVHAHTASMYGADFPSFPFQHDQTIQPATSDFLLPMRRRSGIDFARVFDDDDDVVDQMSLNGTSYSETIAPMLASTPSLTLNWDDAQPSSRFDRRFSSIDDDPIPFDGYVGGSSDVSVSPNSHVSQKWRSIDLSIFDEPLVWSILCPSLAPTNRAATEEPTVSGNASDTDEEVSKLVANKSSRREHDLALAQSTDSIPPVSLRTGKRKIAQVFDDATTSEYLTLRKELDASIAQLECHEQIVADWEIRHISIWNHIYQVDGDFDSLLYQAEAIDCQGRPNLRSRTRSVTAHRALLAIKKPRGQTAQV